jgi:hypothetical protein
MAATGLWSAGACSRFPKRRQAAALQNEPVLPISCSPFHQKRMLFALPCTSRLPVSLWFNQFHHRDTEAQRKWLVPYEPTPAIKNKLFLTRRHEGHEGGCRFKRSLCAFVPLCEIELGCGLRPRWFYRLLDVARTLSRQGGRASARPGASRRLPSRVVVSVRGASHILPVRLFLAASRSLAGTEMGSRPRFLRASLLSF